MNETDKNYARCFGTPSGVAVLAHLRQITIERAVGPNVSDGELRWFAAQSALVRHIETLVARGRGDQT